MTENSLIRGQVDHLEAGMAHGWVFDPKNPDTPLTIEVVQNGNIVGRTLANIYREDLKHAGIGSGFCSFFVEFDHSLDLGQNIKFLSGGITLPCPEFIEKLSNNSIPSIEGSVDYCRPNFISGWVWRPSNKIERLTVEIISKGELVSVNLANIYREDLLSVENNDGFHAFEFTFNPPLDDSEMPVIRIRDAVPSEMQVPEVWSEPINEYFSLEKDKIEVSLQKIAEFHLDHFDYKGISGWVWYPSEPEASVSIDIYNGDQLITSSIAEILRPDLLKAGKGTGKYGFALKFDSSKVRQSSALKVRIGGVTEVSALAFREAVKNEKSTKDSDIIKTEGNVDTITHKSASGWAWAPSAPKMPLMVEARIGDRVIGRGLANKMRKDLLKWNKGTGEYGFDFEFYEIINGDTNPEFHIYPFRSNIIKNSTVLNRMNADEERRFKKSDVSNLMDDHFQFTHQGPGYETADPNIIQILDTSSLETVPLIFAYYLPQFHAIPENDRFWGKGFTEWRQITRAISRFPGHYQPRIPRDLGFYDLGDPTILFKQAELAKSAGINAFCYYYYWFNGTRVLEKPLDNHISSDVDMPLMIMWANENWTKTWDGTESDVLLRQDYKEEDEEFLLSDLAKYFLDSRYVKINGRPLFFIYNPNHIPDAPNTIARWRKKLLHSHGIDPLIFMAQAFESVDPRPFGLDGAIEFPPHKLATPHPGRVTLDAYSTDFKGRVISYDDFVETSLGEPLPDFPLIKTIVPSWDNDARRPGRGLTLENATPSKYEAWLKALIEQALDNPIDGVPLVAVNAWNEWAEAAYLEPDIYYGGAYLNATARALTSAVKEYVPLAQREQLHPVSVIMPCYNHARFLSDRIASVVNQTVPPAEIIFLDDASTDDSVAVARKLLKNSGIPYRIEVNKKNSGNVFKQWLKGIKRAKNDIVWIAETDDSADLQFLKNIMPSFNNDRIRGAYGQIKCIDPDGNIRNDIDNYYNGMKYHSWSGSIDIAAAKSFNHDFSVCNVIPNASGFVFRKPLLSTEEEKRLLTYRFAGDWYIYALILRGGELAYRPRAKSWFRVNPGSASRSAFFSDRHLKEHQMVLEHLASEFGLSEEAFNEHVRRLKTHFPDKTEDDVRQILKPGSFDRKLRICVAAHSFSVGGGEVVPIELANKLRRLGHHVTYLITDIAEEGASTIRDRLRSDIPVIHWDEISDDIVGFINNYRIDVVNSHNVGVDYHLYKKNVELPCIWISSLHGGYETVPHLLTSEFISYLQKHVDAWLPLAEKNRQILIESGLKNADFRDSFNAVPDTPVAWIDSEAFLQQEKIPKDAFTLVICSRAIEEKGWRTAIDVCRRLNDRQERPVHLFMIGDGPILANLRRENVSDPTLHFMGHVEAPMRYFRSFDMAIFPSTYVGETFPLFLVECLASGLPMITTDIGEIPRIIGPADIRAGKLVSFQQSPEAMAAEMADLIELYLSDTEQMDAVKINANVGAERFSMSKLAELYLSVIHEKISASTK